MGPIQSRILKKKLSWDLTFDFCNCFSIFSIYVDALEEINDSNLSNCRTLFRTSFDLNREKKKREKPTLFHIMKWVPFTIVDVYENNKRWKKMRMKTHLLAWCAFVRILFLFCVTAFKQWQIKIKGFCISRFSSLQRPRIVKHFPTV